MEFFENALGDIDNARPSEVLRCYQRESLVRAVDELGPKQIDLACKAIPSLPAIAKMQAAKRTFTGTATSTPQACIVAAGDAVIMRPLFAFIAEVEAASSSTRCALRCMSNDPPNSRRPKVASAASKLKSGTNVNPT
jgi:hypothetical protein